MAICRHSLGNWLFIMNLFILDKDPIKSAMMLCDKHVVKQTLETAQLLSTAQRFFGKIVTYKSTHINHPCSLWVRMNVENYMWAWKHGLSLCLEYTHRYGKVHKCESLYLRELCDVSFIPSGHLEDFVLCMPDSYKCKDAIKSYQDYYIHEKGYFAKWTNREKPLWFDNNKME